MGYHALLGSSKLALKAVGQRSATSNEVSGVSKYEPINESDEPETRVQEKKTKKKLGLMNCFPV